MRKGGCTVDKSIVSGDIRTTVKKRMKKKYIRKNVQIICKGNSVLDFACQIVAHKVWLIIVLCTEQYLSPSITYNYKVVLKFFSP